MRAKFRTEGFKELDRALKLEIPRTAQGGVLLRAAKAAMKRIEAKMKQLAPKDHGDLERSIVTRAVPKAGRQSRVEVATGPAPRGTINRSNASWQEFGTVDMPAHPYARPAADEEAPKVIDDLRGTLTVEIAKTAARIRARAAKGK